MNAVNANGETPLHVAAWKGRTALCRALLRTPTLTLSSTLIRDLIFGPSLVIATPTLTLSLTPVHGADVHQENNRGETPMHFAARSGSLDTVKLLVASQGDLHKEGATTLTSTLIITFTLAFSPYGVTVRV